MSSLETRGNVSQAYADVLSPQAMDALEALAGFDADRKAVMDRRIAGRAARARDKQRLAFLDPDAEIARTRIRVQDARAGAFVGSEIPADLRRQWIQGTGPAARPDVPLARSIRNVAYALLSGADGWMFDGEDALGQVSTMSLDNQRNLKLAIHQDDVFLRVAEEVAGEMNQWARGFFGRPIVEEWRAQLDFTTKIFRPRGLHLDDRHIRHRGGDGFSASIVDASLYVVNNHRELRRRGSSLVLYLPKIQTAEEAALDREPHGGPARRSELRPRRKRRVRRRDVRRARGGADRRRGRVAGSPVTRVRTAGAASGHRSHRADRHPRPRHHRGRVPAARATTPRTATATWRRPHTTTRPARPTITPTGAANDLGLGMLQNGHHADMEYKELSPADQAKVDKLLAVSRDVALKYPTLGVAIDAGAERAGPFAPGLVSTTWHRGWARASTPTASWTRTTWPTR